MAYGVLQTTIKLSHKTKQRLSDQGTKGMSYDEIVNSILDNQEYGENQ